MRDIEPVLVEGRHERLQPPPSLGPWQRAQVPIALDQYVIQPHERGEVLAHLGRNRFAPQPLLQRVEAGRLAALHVAAYQQFAIHHAICGKGLCDVGKARRNVVAAPAVEPDGAMRPHNLNADAVPLPFGGIVGQIDARFLQRMRQHEGPEIGRALGVGPFGPAFAPGEQLGIRRAECMPHLFDIIDIQLESLRHRRLGQPCRYTHTHAPAGQLQQRIAPIGVEPVHQTGQQLQRLGPARVRQQVDNGGDAQIIFGGHTADRLGPHQRDRLGRIADIVPAHAEQ